MARLISRTGYDLEAVMAQRRPKRLGTPSSRRSEARRASTGSRDFQKAVDTLAARHPPGANITFSQQANDVARTTRRDCRTVEALACAVARRCEEQVILKFEGSGT